MRGAQCSLLALLMGCATAQPWSRGHELLAVAAGTAVFGDCASTQHILRTDSTWVEANPILGRRPESVVLWSACAIGFLGVVMVADALPPAVRVTWLALVTTVEVVAMGHNLDWWYIPLWRWGGRR